MVIVTEQPFLGQNDLRTIHNRVISLVTPLIVTASLSVAVPRAPLSTVGNGGCSKPLQRHNNKKFTSSDEIQECEKN